MRNSKVSSKTISDKRKSPGIVFEKVEKFKIQISKLKDLMSLHVTLHVFNDCLM